MKGRGKSIRNGGYYAKPQRSSPSMPQVDLHGLRHHIGEARLKNFMQDAYAKRTPSVKVIHGHGQGVMRQVAYDWIKENDYRISDHTDDGPAVIVHFKYH